MRRARAARQLEEALNDIADKMIDAMVPRTGLAHHSNVAPPRPSAARFAMMRTSLVPTPRSSTSTPKSAITARFCVTTGKMVYCSSSDDLFYSDLILIWGGNPIYTQIPNAHFITEARYNGARVITIAPDY